MKKQKTYPWRVGWSPDNRRFYFKAPSGYSMMLSGARKTVTNTALQMLPKMLDVAKKATDRDNDPEFVAAIEAAITELQALDAKLPTTPDTRRRP